MECVMCGMCAARCPAELAPFNIALLVRRMYGKHGLPPSPQLNRRLREIEEKKFAEELNQLKKMETSELQERYRELQATKGASV
jgi:heterodisulfide reductase subunit C